jgi:hypothetical protein
VSVGLRRERLGDAEVEQLHGSRLAEHHVVWLEVAVDHAGRVGGGERLGDAARDGDGFRHGQRPIAEPRSQRAPRDELHHDVQPIGALADLVHRRDPGVRDGRSRARLAQEALAARRIRGDLARQHLQRDAPAQPLVFCLVDDAHAAASELAQDAKPLDALVGSQLVDHGRRASISPSSASGPPLFENTTRPEGSSSRT